MVDECLHATDDAEAKVADAQAVVCFLKPVAASEQWMAPASTGSWNSTHAIAFGAFPIFTINSRPTSVTISTSAYCRSFFDQLK